MNRFFKTSWVIIGIVLVIATISEIARPAVNDGWGIQWPVYVGGWAFYLFIGWYAILRKDRTQ